MTGYKDELAKELEVLFNDYVFYADQVWDGGYFFCEEYGLDTAIACHSALIKLNGAKWSGTKKIYI